MKFRLVEKVNTEVDSDGNQLTHGQIDYFKNSTIRNSSGNLLVVYHGTTVDNLNFFKNSLNFFSANPDYAKRYSRFENSHVLKCYLNITNPFTLNNEKCKTIFINEYIKGGYANGISPYSTDKEIFNYINGGIDWVEADNLLEFLQENGYNEFDGLIINEGGDLTDSGPVSRGDSFVAFRSNQIKLITNINPTNSNNINESEK